ncbi:MAG: hypothetical protein FD143_3662, partial [Ignavibacteria bacterium]
YNLMKIVTLNLVNFLLHISIIELVNVTPYSILRMGHGPLKEIPLF